VTSAKVLGAEKTASAKDGSKSLTISSNFKHPGEASALKRRRILQLRSYDSAHNPDGSEQRRVALWMSTSFDRFSRISFFLSLAVLVMLGVFVYGIAVGWAKVWPHSTLRIIVDHLRSVYMAGAWQPRDRFVWAPPGAARKRMVLSSPDLFEAGYRAIMGWNGQSYGVWLIDPQMEEIHYWPINYETLDPDGPSMGSDEPHGMKILEDGSILVNFDRGDVLARLDACGEPLWVKKGIFHHSIDRAEDGTLWTWRGDQSAYGEYQYLVNIDATTGQTIEEYSLLDDFVNGSPEQRQIFAVPGGYRYSRQNGQDLFHPNDVEALRSDMAGEFPHFRPGDLLVSFREIHLVAVLDRVTKQVKWWQNGPWRFQHDPDFASNGKIIVYNNNRDRGRSDIIAIDPDSREFDVAYSDGDLHFYSGTAGKVQTLPGGALLIVVPDEGRVIEASWSGELIFEFNNVWSESVNAYVVNAVWLPKNFFNKEPSCP
jgi:Arylsulfotransferase (ASST)